MGTGGVGGEEVSEELVGAGDLDGGDAYREAGAALGLLLAHGAEEPRHGRRHKSRLPRVVAAAAAATVDVVDVVIVVVAVAQHGAGFAEFGVAEGQDAAVGTVDDRRDDVAQHRARYVHLAAVNSTIQHSTSCNALVLFFQFIYY